MIHTQQHITENIIEYQEEGESIGLFIECSTKNQYEQFKSQILDSYQLVEHCKFLDFDAILFAMQKERVNSSDPENSHLNLKILQVKKLKYLLTKLNKSENDSQ